MNFVIYSQKKKLKFRQSIVEKSIANFVVQVQQFAKWLRNKVAYFVKRSLKEITNYNNRSVKKSRTSETIAENSANFDKRSRKIWRILTNDVWKKKSRISANDPRKKIVNFDNLWKNCKFWQTISKNNRECWQTTSKKIINFDKRLWKKIANFDTVVKKIANLLITNFSRGTRKKLRILANDRQKISNFGKRSSKEIANFGKRSWTNSRIEANDSGKNRNFHNKLDLRKQGKNY